MKNKSSKLNCWDWKHPIRSIKNAYWRITKGFCPSDVWDWYTYQANLIHDSLMYWSAHSMSTPYEYESNPSAWNDKLEYVARTLLTATYYEDNYENAFENRYFEQLENAEITDMSEEGKTYFTLDDTKIDKELTQHYMETLDKNYRQAKREVKSAFDWIAENWFDLWD